MPVIPSHLPRGPAPLVAAACCLAVMSAPAHALPQCGKASWYEMQGRTASGGHHDPLAMTAAHRKLPFGTLVRVSNVRNGLSVIVTITDRGPFIRGRIIDVSRSAAAKIGIQRRGVGKVRVSSPEQPDRGCR